MRQESTDVSVPKINPNPIPTRAEIFARPDYQSEIMAKDGYRVPPGHRRAMKLMDDVVASAVSHTNAAMANRNSRFCDRTAQEAAETIKDCEAKLSGNKPINTSRSAVEDRLARARAVHDDATQESAKQKQLSGQYTEAAHTFVASNARGDHTKPSSYAPRDNKPLDKVEQGMWGDNRKIDQ